MEHVLKLRAIGTSTGVVLPEELLARLNVEKGDVLFVTETPGGLLLTPHDPKVGEQVRLGREVMRRYRETLRALAK